LFVSSAFNINAPIKNRVGKKAKLHAFVFIIKGPFKKMDCGHRIRIRLMVVEFGNGFGNGIV
jgi:hypothetical protein